MLKSTDQCSILYNYCTDYKLNKRRLTLVMVFDATFNKTYERRLLGTKLKNLT